MNSNKNDKANQSISSELFIGIISGTSMDAIDIALVDCAPKIPKLVLGIQHPYPAQIKNMLFNIAGKADASLLDICKLDVILGEIFAQGVMQLLHEVKLSPQNIRAIGSHGQTLFHGATLNPKFSLQVGDPNIITFQTGITTVADFRRHDLAAQGQGAPLVPAFHQVVLQHPSLHRVILNIGGIANITFLPAQDNDLEHQILGYDTGPGNGLMDTWTQHHLNKPFDQNGNWAQQGKINPSLLDKLFEHPFFNLKSPKSTGREDFNFNWLKKVLNQIKTELNPVDVQATLLQFTIKSIITEVVSLPVNVDELIICGGGAENSFLVSQLTQQLPTPTKVFRSESKGIDSCYIEAMTFAWLAHQRLQNIPGNVPSVTGANKAVVLGGIYSAI